MGTGRYLSPQSVMRMSEGCCNTIALLTNCRAPKSTLQAYPIFPLQAMYAFAIT